MRAALFMGICVTESNVRISWRLSLLCEAALRSFQGPAIPLASASLGALSLGGFAGYLYSFSAGNFPNLCQHLPVLQRGEYLRV